MAQLLTIDCPVCPHCGKRESVKLNEDESRRWYRTWRSGFGDEHIQAVFPEWTADQRELVMTGYHAECWDAIWGDVE